MKKIKIFLSLSIAILATIAAPTLTAAGVSCALNDLELFKPIATTLDTIALGIPVTKFLVHQFGNEYWQAKFSYVGNMAFETPFTEGLCQKIQSSLIEIFKAKAPSMKRTQVGYLSALMSDVNTAGVTQVPLPQNGKIRQVLVKFIQRADSSDIVTTDPVCEAEDNPSPKEQIVENVTSFVRTKEIGFDDNDMRLLCESGDEYRAGIINSYLNALMVSLDKKLITAQAANFGAYVPSISPATYKDYGLLNNVNYSINFKGESDIEEDIANLESNDKPIVIGDGYLAHYVKQAKIGCCNALGQDLNQVGQMYYYRDKYVSQILGTNHFIILIPGYTQVLFWNKYKGEFTQNDNLCIRGTIVDPYTGVECDIKWLRNNCDENWILHLRVWYKLYQLPTDAFKTYDDLNGVNFSLHARATAV